MEQLKRNLEGEYVARLEQLGEMELGTEEYKFGTESMIKYVDRLIEIEKIEADKAAKAKQQKSDNIDKIAKHSVDVLKFGVGLGAGVVVYMASMKFEKDGLLPTTPGGRKMLDNFLKMFKF